MTDRQKLITTINSLPGPPPLVRSDGNFYYLIPRFEGGTISYSTLDLLTVLQNESRNNRIGYLHLIDVEDIMSDFIVQSNLYPLLEGREIESGEVLTSLITTVNRVRIPTAITLNREVDWVKLFGSLPEVDVLIIDNLPTDTSRLDLINLLLENRGRFLKIILLGDEEKFNLYETVLELPPINVRRLDTSEAIILAYPVLLTLLEHYVQERNWDEISKMTPALKIMFPVLEGDEPRLTLDDLRSLQNASDESVAIACDFFYNTDILEMSAQALQRYLFYLGLWYDGLHYMTINQGRFEEHFLDNQENQSMVARIVAFLEMMEMEKYKDALKEKLKSLVNLYPNSLSELIKNVVRGYY